MSNEGRAYGWDETVENPNEGPSFTLLQPGDYTFKVVKFARGRHEQTSGKLPSCNKAIITLELYGGDQGNATIDHNLFLHSSCEGFLCQFFVSIGLRKHGEPLRMDWNKVAGCIGRCKIKHRSGTKNPDAKFMEIDRFLDPEGAEEPQESATKFAF